MQKTNAGRIAWAEFQNLAPKATAALIALSSTAEGLDSSLTELVKLRVSQINGCAFCVHMHSAKLRHDGVANDKLDSLVVWRESPRYSSKERAALTWAEALTELHPDHVSDADYALASAEFSPAELASLTAAIVTINSWNRIAIAYRFPPAGGPAAPRAAAE
jgi:AhpD family alkylhydroperoxidase